MANLLPVDELSVDAAWDKLLDTTLRRAVYGGLAGGAAALVLLRAFVFFGSGAMRCGVSELVPLAATAPTQPPRCYTLP